MKWIILLALSFAVTACGRNGELNYAVETDSIIPSYQPRFDRKKPIITVVGENTYTELTDFVIPYGVLKESGVANVITLGTKKGMIQMFPALKLKPDSTTSDFDSQYPLGSDYVFVPAVHNSNDETLIKWVVEQADKGATIIGVCDGVRVLANAGLLRNKKAVSHWYSFGKLSEEFTETKWLSNARYVADEDIVTTTGVTASIPVSIAIIEALAGREKAVDTAQKLGINNWTPEHHSQKFQLNLNYIKTAASNWLSFLYKDEIAIPVSEGVDEISLALIADSYSRTYKSKAFSVSRADGVVLSKRGLKILADRDTEEIEKFDHIIELRRDQPAIDALDFSLAGIEKLYGKGTADWVALQIEYPTD